MHLHTNTCAHTCTRTRAHTPLATSSAPKATTLVHPGARPTEEELDIGLHPVPGGVPGLRTEPSEGREITPALASTCAVSSARHLGVRLPPHLPRCPAVLPRVPRAEFWTGQLQPHSTPCGLQALGGRRLAPRPPWVWAAAGGGHWISEEVRALSRGPLCRPPAVIMLSPSSLSLHVSGGEEAPVMAWNSVAAAAPSVPTGRQPQTRAGIVTCPSVSAGTQ